MNHLANHIKNSQLKTDSTLHVIGVIQNAVRYQSRYRLFKAWAQEMLKTPNVKLYVIEATYGDRAPECSPKEVEPGEIDLENYQYLEVTSTSEIWLKENLINLGVKRLLPADWKYMAWVDCDVKFADPGWALATVHQLQHYNIVQPWQSAADLDFHGAIQNTWTSFGSLCASGKPMTHDKAKQNHGYTYAHTGYAWACTRYFYENVEKLADWNIVGAGDHLMAWACLGEVDGTMPKAISAGYRGLCEAWQAKAVYASAKLVGFTPGRLEHNWHGSKTNRRYWSRWDILKDYNPVTDLAYDSQGVLILTGPRKYQIEQAIMKYNRGRLEDDLHD